MIDDVDYVTDVAAILIKLMPVNTTPTMLTIFSTGVVNFDGYGGTNIMDLFPVKTCLLRDKTIWSITMTRNQIWGLSIYTMYQDGMSGKAVRGDDIDLWFKNNIIVK